MLVKRNDKNTKQNNIDYIIINYGVHKSHYILGTTDPTNGATVAKNTFTEDPKGSSSGSKPGWATQKPFRDPITGKVLPQNPQGEASPVGSDLGKGFKR